MSAYIFYGLLGVSNMVLWGIYGDLSVEKFELRKVLRSLFFGAFWSCFLYLTDNALPPFVIALSVISLERITTEIYKALIRKEDQSKYLIPSDLKIRFHHVLKKILGVFILAVIAVAIYFVDIAISNIAIIFIVGMFNAIAGAAKDAPYEGFDKIKFFRSPVVSIAMGIFLIYAFPLVTGKFFLLAVAGGERIISEFYKKIFRGKTPGKFKGIVINESWVSERKWILPLYFLSVISLVYLLFLSN